VHINFLVIQSPNWLNTRRSPFDKLRANGTGVEFIEEFPFVLSLSKHEHPLARTVPEF